MAGQQRPSRDVSREVGQGSGAARVMRGYESVNTEFVSFDTRKVAANSPRYELSGELTVSYRLLRGEQSSVSVIRKNMRGRHLLPASST